MTPRAWQTLMFTFASVFTAPFALVLLVLAVPILVPTMAYAPLGTFLLYAYMFVPSPIGIVVSIGGAWFVWSAIRSRPDTRLRFYLLLIYALILSAVLAYISWWHITGQRYDLP